MTSLVNIPKNGPVSIVLGARWEKKGTRTIQESVCSIYQAHRGWTALDIPGVKGNDAADRSTGKATYKWLASQKIRSVEELETLPAGTKPGTPHHRSPGRREA